MLDIRFNRMLSRSERLHSYLREMWTRIEHVFRIDDANCLAEGKLKTRSRYFGNKQKGLIRECFRFSLTSAIRELLFAHLYGGCIFPLSRGAIRAIRISNVINICLQILQFRLPPREEAKELLKLLEKHLSVTVLMFSRLNKYDTNVHFRTTSKIAFIETSVQL